MTYARTVEEVDANLAEWIEEATLDPRKQALARKMCDLWLDERNRIAPPGASTLPCR